jgi:hypothetical protein
MGDASRITKRQRAIQLRDLALQVIQTSGSWSSSGEVKALKYRGDDLSILYRTPFQRLPETPDHIKYMGAFLGVDTQNLPYGLDIWSLRKVLNIEWDDKGRVILVSYKRGEWEKKLEALALELAA